MKNTKPIKLGLPKLSPKLIPSTQVSSTGQSTQEEHPDSVGFTKKMPPLFALREQKNKALTDVFESRKSQLLNLIKEIEKERNSSVIVYFSRNLLNTKEVANFYQLFSGNNKINNLDLILQSNGGIADDAFKMARLCRQHVEGKFSVLVPYRAKSAATLLALGADELVMGPSSEIGPVDPMIYVRMQDGNNYLVPAHSIKDGLDFFESRIKTQPETAAMYSQLMENLDVTVVGAYQRAIESSKQYASALLQSGLLKDKPEMVEKAAKAFGEKYKSHAFVIDRNIAKDEYGLNILNAPEPLWEKMWYLHNLLDFWMEEDPTLGTIIKTSNSEIFISYAPMEGPKNNGSK